MSAEVLAAACGYLGSGLSVIPCDAVSKRPLVKWERFQSERATEAEVREWWSCFPDARVAIVTGSVSGIVVVDVDSTALEASAAVAQRFGETPRVARTPRGGQHHYFSHPGTSVPNAVRLACFEFPVDLRADRGYVLAPPSTGYQWIRTAPRRDLPVFRTDLLANRGVSVPSERHRDPHSWRSLLAGVPLGQRNAALAKLVGSMLAKGIPPDVSRLAAREWSRGCDPPMELDEVESVVGSILEREDRQKKNRCGQAVTVNLADVEPEHVSWLWPGRIAFGKVTLVEGDPGLGKSALTCDVAARITTGRPMPDGPAVEVGAVVFLSAEDGLGDTIRPRLETAGADLSRIVAVTVVRSAAGERLPELPADLDELERVIRERGARLVVVDPLMAFLGGEVNSWRDQDVRRALAPLSRVAERTGAAIVVVRHLTKGSGGPAIYRGGGSIGIAAAARSVLLLAKDPDDEERRVLAPVKSNLSQPAGALAFRLTGDPVTGAACVEWLGATDRTADELLAVPTSGEERSALDEARRFLSGLLADGAVSANRVQRQARAAGFSDATLRRAKKALGIRPHRRGFGPQGEWVWELPGSHRCSIDDIDAQSQGVSTYDADGAPMALAPPCAENGSAACTPPNGPAPAEQHVVAGSEPEQELEEFEF